MNKLFLKLSALLLTLLVFSLSTALAGTRAIAISEPASGATVSSPVKVCMVAHGVTVEPAKNGVNDDKGHHHILIDADLPTDLSKPVGKDAQHVHMGDGSTCKELNLDAGIHVIRALFAQGNHVPFNPPITATVIVNVK
ncbi:MAG: DUF4399 domain-containing protein [Nitrospinota bacterium]|nr:DUF4399 domain-containing protein [Nitrospinota bacterium]